MNNQETNIKNPSPKIEDGDGFFSLAPKTKKTVSQGKPLPEKIKYIINQTPGVLIIQSLHRKDHTTGEVTNLTLERNQGIAISQLQETEKLIKNSIEVRALYNFGYLVFASSKEDAKANAKRIYTLEEYVDEHGNDRITTRVSIEQLSPSYKNEMSQFFENEEVNSESINRGNGKSAKAVVFTP